jgi:protein required for attachment to host cells
LFERDPDNGALRELAAFVHPGSRLKAGTTEHDRAGQGVHGAGRAHFEPATPPREREQQHFADELARHLEDAALDGRLGSFALIASNPFLGRLRSALRSGAAARLDEHFERDLTAYAGHELELRVSELLPRRPGSPN